MNIASNIPTFLGTANGESIIAVSGLSNVWEKKTITLLTDYSRDAPSDWPNATPGVPTGPVPATKAVFPAGAVLTVYQTEAYALIAAGAAVASE
jgi:hypothetical protein